MCMRQLIKYFLWIVCLALGFQSAWAFSLLGPVGSAGITGGTVEDNWQITDLGYDPLPNAGALPFIGTTTHTFGPKNIGEGYRYNTPVIYYDFDEDFSGFFGANGEDAVEQAFDVLNGVLNGQTNALMYITAPNTGVLMGATNDVFNGPTVVLSPANGIDKYTTNLTEFPLNSQGVNYQAQVLNLTDLKSITLTLMLRQLGLADAVRYTWGLLNRYLPVGGTCTPTTPPSTGPGSANGVDYWVIQRNYDIVPSALTNYQYSPYINSELYSYYIWDTCNPGPPNSPPIADALEIPVDPLNFNPPVASGLGEGALPAGGFYTGLTRDDVAGLRYLLSTNNIFDPAPGYQEQAAGGSALFSTNVNAPQLLYTSNLNVLVSTSLTNNPATLQAMYPGLQFGLISSSFSNVVSPVVVAYLTNYFGAPAGAPPTLVVTTNYVTNIVEFYQYAFNNVVTNKSYSTTTYKVQTITVGPYLGAPAGAPFVTNITYSTYQSNVVSGDFFIITNGFCGPNIIQTLQTNVDIVTNTLATNSFSDGQLFVQNLISYSTNHVFVVQPCTLISNAVADYQGIGRMQFVRLPDDAYDSLNGQFFQQYWITNQYSMVVITNHQLVTRHFQRVVTRPDIVFGAQSMLNGSGNSILTGAEYADSQPNFIDSRAPNLAGPGIIDPTTSSNISIIFNAVEPVYTNVSPNFITGPFGVPSATLNWGSYDGTTNAPIVYPNGTSIENLAAEAFYQISPPPPTLPDGTNGVSYNVTFTATGTSGTVSWTLAPNSAGLPPGLTLSPDGVISGIPTQSAIFDGIVIQMSDVFQLPYSSSLSTNTADLTYSLTIN